MSPPTAILEPPRDSATDTDQHRAAEVKAIFALLAKLFQLFKLGYKN